MTKKAEHPLGQGLSGRVAPVRVERNFPRSPVATAAPFRLGQPAELGTLLIETSEEGLTQSSAWRVLAETAEISTPLTVRLPRRKAESLKFAGGRGLVSGARVSFAKPARAGRKTAHGTWGMGGPAQPSRSPEALARGRCQPPAASRPKGFSASL